MITTQETLVESDFIFSAHCNKAFRKLSENQLGDPDKWVLEIIANALDANSGSDPIRIRISTVEDACFFSVEDNGAGLTVSNLESLHFIGRSTKKENRDNSIGRFGMGFVSAFNPANGITDVKIETLLDCRPVRIKYLLAKEKKGTIPQWQIEYVDPEDVPAAGTRFTFKLPEAQRSKVESLVVRFWKETVVPVVFNGRLRSWNPAEREGERMLQIADAANEVKVFIWASRKELSMFGADSLRIVLRGMPLESGSAHKVVRYGDKMIQNSTGVPYLPDETIVCLSKIGEPTIGRDKFVRNKEFTRIQETILDARAQMVCCLLTEPAIGKAYSDSLAFANIYTLSQDLAKFLQCPEDLAEDRRWLRPLLESLVDYRAFAIFGSASRYSLRQIYKEWRGRTKGIILTASNCSIGQQISHSLPGGDFDSGKMLPWNICGGWQLPVTELLTRVFNNVSSPEFKVYSVEDVIFSDAIKDELEEQGILTSYTQQIKVEQELSDELSEWLTGLRKCMNQPWFKKTLSSRAREIRRLKVLPISVEASDKSQQSRQPLCMIVSDPNSRPGEMVMGVNVKHDTLPSLVTKKTKGYALFMPTLAQNVATYRYGTFVLNDERTNEQRMAYTDDFLFDSIAISDAIVHGAVNNMKNILQPEMFEEEETIEDEVIIL